MFFLLEVFHETGKASFTPTADLQTAKDLGIGMAGNFSIMRENKTKP